MNSNSRTREGPAVLLEMAEPKDFRVGCEFYLSVALKAANDLRTALRIDEESFRRIAPMAWQDPRPAFIYRVLDEVQKAGIAIKDWSEKLGESEWKPEYTEHLIRLVTQWQQDEQSFRARKLSEILIDLICFSQTNEAEYYRDYLRLRELDTSVRSLRDQHEFFGFRRRNTEHEVDCIGRDIQSAEEKGLDVSRRWYLKEPMRFRNKWKITGPKFSSFRERYIRILNIALPSELAVIGKSYVHAYNMSSDIHFSPNDTSWDFNPDDIYLGIDRVGLLCYAVVIRCQLLLGVVPAGINTQIRKIHDENTEPARLVGGLKDQSAEVGDFVWVKGDIGRVKEVRKSKYGYTNYLVHYVEQPPIPQIEEDGFAGGEVRLVAKKSVGEEVLRRLRTDPTLDENGRRHLANMSAEEHERVIGQAVAKRWRLQQKMLADARGQKSQQNE